ncbi:MAG: 50S ribosomal protein L4 [Halanaerobium sp.]|nr:50S ribosomal protein L4 [Halanaerobium sp.]
MPKVGVFNFNGEQTGELDLNEEVFGVAINVPVMHEVLTAQLASKRGGTAKTKTRGEVRGGGRKPWRQKGTGRARHGSIRSPLWVGGGTIFGPQPRSYRKRIPKKVKKLAVKSALSAHVSEERLRVVEELPFAEPKTRRMIEFLQKMGLEGEKVLIVLPGKDEEVYKSARNIPHVKTMVAGAVNIYDLLNHEYIIILQDAIDKLEEVLVS